MIYLHFSKAFDKFDKERKGRDEEDENDESYNEEVQAADRDGSNNM